MQVQSMHFKARAGQKLADTRLQRGLRVPAFDLGELLMNYVMIDVELAVLNPVGTGGVFHHPLAKTRVLEQTLFDALA